MCWPVRVKANTNQIKEISIEWPARNIYVTFTFTK